MEDGGWREHRLPDRVRADRHMDGPGGVEQVLQLVHHRAAENVLDGVGVAVHVAGSDVRVRDEINEHLRLFVAEKTLTSHES